MTLLTTSAALLQGTFALAAKILSARQRLAFVLVATLSSMAYAQGPTPGQNVNMVSGTKWPGGDPFLQRQNEPSIAVSTRNPQHLLAGANDYRTVDLNLIDQLPINQLGGDAWLGVFKSFDGGQRWQSTLLPGFMQDGSSFGAASPMKGFGAASDPVVRAGTNGMFYYSSIALNRNTNIGGLFLSRFIDLNNKENGDAAQSNYPSPTTDPIRYLNTVEIDSGSAGQFIDKPWIATDIPRGGAVLCSMQVPVDNGATVTQTFYGGNVYIAYAMFVGGNVNVRSKINFSKSSDCGNTWTKPIMISQTYAINQGTQVAVDPETGYVYVAWRVFSGANESDEIVVAKSTDFGNSFSKAVPVRMLSPYNSTTPTASAFFDEGTTNTAFRTQSMPTIAVDDSGYVGLPGNVYVAWSERGVGLNGDARVMISVSADGINWPPNPTPVDNGALADDASDQFTRGHQLMPAMTFIGGKLMIVYYDLRLDHTMGLFSLSNPFPDRNGRFFLEDRLYLGDDPSLVFTPFVDDAGLTKRRHTIDVMLAQSSGGLTPTFTRARVSQYDLGLPAPEGNGDEFEQLKLNPPNLPMFSQGQVPFIGDYIDIAGQMFAPIPGGGWTFNNPLPPSVSGSTAATKPPAGSPIHYSTWTTNQDVIPPANGDWTKYYAIPLGPTSTFNGQTMPACTAGFESDRNQNIYDSRITQGLLVTSPQNSKPLLDKNGNPIQRAFAVLVQNSTNLTKYFQLKIANQPRGNFNINNGTVGGYASFQQAVPNQPALPNPLPAPVTISNVAMGPHSGAVRSVFVISSVINASVSVNVNETDQNGNILSGGLSSFIVLNADPSVVAALALPDGATSDPNLAEIYDPNIITPNIITPNIITPNIITPNIITPNIITPNIITPNIITPNIITPNIITTNTANPNIITPNIITPNIITNSLTDAVYTITNKGDTSAGYHVQLTGNTNKQLQLAVAQVYTTPTSFQCALIPQVQNVTLINVTSPEFTPVNQLGTPNIITADPNDATIYLTPGDTAQIVLRAPVDIPAMQQIVSQVTPVVVPEAVDTNSTATTPPVITPLFITTASLPDGVAPIEGNSTFGTLTAIGGNLSPSCPGTWSLSNAPAGLLLSSASFTSGNPGFSSVTLSGALTPGTYVFTAQVQDCASDVATRQLRLNVSPPLQLASSPLPGAFVGLGYAHSLVSGGTGTYTAAVTGGALPSGLTINSAGLLTGTPTAANVYSFTVNITDTANPPQSASGTFSLTIAVCAGGIVTFTQQPTNVVAGFPITPAVLITIMDCTGAVIPNVNVTMSLGTAPDGAILSGTTTVATNAVGQATFSGLSVNIPGTYSLIATVNSIQASSSPFTATGWQTMAAFADPRPNGGAGGTVSIQDAAASIINGKIYVSHGFRSIDSNLLSIYDIASDTWNQSSSLPSASVARSYLGSGAASGKHYAIGGEAFDNPVFATVEQFDPVANTWTTMSPMPTARAGLGVASWNNLIYAVGGRTGLGDGAGTILNVLEKFNPVANSWSPLVAMPTAVSDISATVAFNGKIYVFGGATAFNSETFTLTVVNLVQIYDIASNTWTTGTSMPTARAAALAAVNGSRIIVAGGVDSGMGNLSVSEIYDPASDTWSTGPSLAVPAGEMSQGMIFDGHNIFAIGQGGSQTGSSAPVQALKF